MRETTAKLVVLATIFLVLALSAIFALRHNPLPNTPQVQSPANSVPETSALERHGCLACHSLRGAGNPRLPLDTVSSRLSRQQLLDGITGHGPAAAKLSPTIQRRKQRYLSLPAPELEQILQQLGARAEPNSGP